MRGTKKIVNGEIGNFLMENEGLVGKTIVNVDIQPEYESGFGFQYEWANFLNEASESNTIVFLFNGEDTLDMISENDYRMWLEDLGVEPDVVDQATFYDKGYAFFRYCMDERVDDDLIVDFVRYMYNNDINDSRDLDEETWNKYVEWSNFDANEIRELLEYSDEMIHIPDLMEYLINLDNIVLTGGGINECLKEVEISLDALQKSYTHINKYTY